ncbi:FlgO family outer membrane protein [Alteromonas gilva]|uniref:FlgO family outer membrane protein n=1 Tax=Alteromonas gilva TaxID=2987522 RepID=A0ABT5KZT6_9ALTE|nr:FlgO family outer membrane protein [Alteromonas gilva]MDC8829766.1 FlgO family outer membrane protein [Alteromonas gilva]
MRVNRNGKNLFGVALFALFLAGCQSAEQVSTEDVVLDIFANEQAASAVQNAPPNRDYSVYSPVNHNKVLSDYAEQIVMQLKLRGQFDKPIAVASYVEFDDNLTTTNGLGNQLAEAVLIEMSNMGYPMMDITTSNAISMNANGSFAFNRDAGKLARDICCVLSGNLIYERRGVKVNTKLLELQTKRVLASNSQLIPYFIAEEFGQVSAR